MLIFTSGSTGGPKAVRMTQGRAARAAARVGFSSDDVLYSAMPLFHGNALSAAILPALASGARLALRRKFSASNFLPDVRECGATFFNSVGRAIAHIVATPPTEHDRDHKLRFVLGPETSAQDKAVFTDRFGVLLIEGYGSSENAIVLRPVPNPRPGTLGPGHPATTWPWSTRTPGRSCRPAVFDEHDRLTNADAASASWSAARPGPTSRATTTIPRPTPSAPATAGTGRVTWPTGTRTGCSTSPVAPATGCGLTARTSPPPPSSAMLGRFAGVSGVAVYPVPDASTGDQVMAAIEIGPGTDLRP